MASAAASSPSPSAIPQTLWDLQVPVLVTHASAPNAPFVASVPRFSYLALLLPRLSAYFGLPCSSFHYEDVLLRNLAVGLLVDLYQPTLPWRLTVADGLSWDIGDTFLNSAKEADFIRNGNAHQIMSLSKEHTTALWNAVQDNDYASFAKVNARLLNTSRGLRNVPIRVYIPHSPDDPAADSQAGSFKVVQSLVQPRVSERHPQTLGAALRSLLPSLFPSSRDPVLADAVLHGVRVPFGAPLEELMREAAYPDGWLCLVVKPLDV
ncbi:autophagy protein Apg5-domain-containing protein [Daldinia vernicosa]|uniref:autophagy protein Apg5-domain-containing protein n=1 Tax=Daldinia vernicosa TaxID=114800 RepID=UPI002008632F|nr:autophagy protein Apg5-domain-containing protein [Daldinia vernicosa]KAI0845981.1 autophagy protein Apg5-domain-containing protein [Daldinia vernicosa]